MAIKDSKLLILLLGILTSFGPMSIDLYLPAFPEIARDLGLESSSLQYTLTSFFIGLSIGQLIYGPISDKFGRKKPLLFGLALFTITSLMIAYAQSLQTVVALRFAQALGSCVGMVITRAIIRDTFNSKDIAKVFSLIILVMGVAPIFAPVLGSQILRFSSWRGLFVFLSVFGAVSFVGTAFLIKESLQTPASIKQSFSNYLSLFTDRQFLCASVISGTALAAMFSYISSSSVVFMDIFKLSANEYPVIFGLNAAGFILVSQMNVRLLNAYSIDRVLSSGMKVFFANSLVLAAVAYLDFGIVFFELALFSVVSCVGLVLPNITAKALEFQGHRAGVASALMGSLQFLIASFGTVLVASLSGLGEWAMVIGLNLFVGLSLAIYLASGSLSNGRQAGADLESSAL